MKFGNEAKHLILVFSLFTFLSLILFWPIFLGKVNLNGNLLVSFYPPYGLNLPFKDSGWDQLRIYFPFYRVTLDALRHFGVPFWNPYAFSGHLHMADFQTAVFYPLNLFGMFLPQVEFWHLLRVTPMVFGSFFTYLFLKNIKLSGIASVFGALAFGFSPYILTWGEEVVMSPHSIIWMPLILFAVDRFIEKKEKRFVGLIAISTVLSFFGGYMQTSIYLFIFVFLYLLMRLGWGRFLSRAGLLILGGIFIGIGMAAVQILPSSELFFNSARSQIRLTETLFSFLLPWRSLATYLAPDFFGSPATRNFFRGGSAQYYEGILFVGIATLVFAFYALVKNPKNRLVVFLFLVGAVSLFSTLNLPTSKLFLYLPVPFLSTSIANRILFIPAFCLGVLGAIGLDEWLKVRDRKVFAPFMVLGVIYLSLAVWVLAIIKLGLPYLGQSGVGAKLNALISLRNLVLPLAVFVLSAIAVTAGFYRPKLKEKLAILVITIFFLQTFYFSQKYFSFSDRRYIFPENAILNFIQENQGNFRSWGIGEAYFENNFASQYSIFWPEGYDSLNNKSYAEFTHGMQGGDINSFSFRADAGLGRGKTLELFSSPGRRKLIDLVGVKYVTSNQNDFELMEKNNFKKVFESGKLGVFENDEVVPRVFLASNYEGPPEIDSTGKTTDEIDAERRKRIPEKLLSPDFDFRNVLVLEKPSPISAQYGPGTAEIVSYRPQEVVVKTESGQPKILFLSDNYYPGWKAKVDGNEVEILRADYTFRAVPLVPGNHTVRFYYDSLIFKVGLMVSSLSLIVLFGYLVSWKINKT